MGVGLSTSMWSGVSGLMANSTRMTTIGDNLANVNTTGFKGSRIDFVDLMSASIGTAAGIDEVGRGVRVGSVTTDYSQGGLETTTSSTDMAISGNGFFMVKQKSQVASNGKVLNTGNQTTYYTRAGNFSFDSDGYLCTSSGLAVQGWEVDQDKVDSASASGTTLSQTPVTGEIRDIKLDSFSSPAKATSNVTVVTNLDSDSTSATGRSASNANYFYAMSESWDGTSDPAMASTAYTYQTTIKVYDQNGSPHTLTVYYDKVSNSGGKEYWEYCVTCDPSEDGRVTASGGKFANTKEGGLLMVGTMTFDSSGSMENLSAYTLKSTASDTTTFDATQWTAADVSSSGYPTFTANFKSVSNASFTDQTDALSITLNLGMRNKSGFTVPASGNSLGDVTSSADTLVYYDSATLKINSSCTTNYATSSSTVFNSQNGYTAGLLTSLSVDSDGVLTGTFSNGQTQQLWVVALANFTNLEGLSSVGDNLYESTLESGQGTTNRPNSGTVGSISGLTLESSNVDMATEMVNMIITQRGFEANSKTITTVDTMLSEIIQLKR
ncbi:MAG: flagellar hook protein FlgE [Solidesulfovibrio sp.]